MCSVMDSGHMQAAAGMGIYGPRTVYVIALKDAPGCHEFLLQDDGKWLHVKETTEIGEALTLVVSVPVIHKVSWLKQVIRALAHRMLPSGLCSNCACAHEPLPE